MSEWSTATATTPETAGDVLDRFYRPNLDSAQVARKCVDYAARKGGLSAALDEAAFEGFRQLCNVRARTSWSTPPVPAAPAPAPTPTRSGHHNSSGRFSRLSPGILGLPVSAPDGTRYALGDVPAEVVDALIANYTRLESGNRADRLFWSSVKSELAQSQQPRCRRAPHT